MVVVIEVHCFECFSLKVSEEIKPQKSISSFLCIGTSVELRKKWKKNYAPSNIWMVEQPQLKDILINQSQYMQNIRKREMHFPTQSIEYNFGPKKSFFPVSFAFPARITTTTANTSIIVCFFFNGIKFGSIHLMSVAFFVSLCPVVSHFGYTVWSAFSVFVVNLRDRAMFQKNLYIIMCVCFGYLGALETLSGSHTSVKLRKKTKRTMPKPMHMNEDQIKWTDTQTNENTGKEDMTKPS